MAEPPALGRHVFRIEARLDGRGRLLLDRLARAWLAVDDPTAFEAVLMPSAEQGLLVVPVEGYARRIEALTS